MKKIFILLFVFSIVFIFPANIISQSNYPMATVITGQEESPEVPVQPEQRANTLQLRWEGFVPGSMQPLSVWQATAGERITLILRANNWFLQQPQPSFFMPEVPLEVLLSAAPITVRERETGILIKLILIPLSAGDVTLPARTLLYGNTNFEIPALTIRVLNRRN